MWLAALAVPAASQSPHRGYLGDPLYVASGDRVRLTSPLAPASVTGRRWVEGAILSIDSLALRIETPGGDSLTFGFDAVTRLQVFRPTRTGSPDGGAAAATLVGFLAGATVGAMACSGADGGDWVAFLPEACAFGTGLGGALLGSHVGRGPQSETDWRSVPLPLRLSFLPGRRPGLALHLVF